MGTRKPRKPIKHRNFGGFSLGRKINGTLHGATTTFGRMAEHFGPSSERAA